MYRSINSSVLTLCFITSVRKPQKIQYKLHTEGHLFTFFTKKTYNIEECCAFYIFLCKSYTLIESIYRYLILYGLFPELLAIIIENETVKCLQNRFFPERSASGFSLRL